MRAEQRRRKGLRESFGDRAKKVGALLAGFGAVVMTTGAAFGLGVETLLTAHRERSILRQVAAHRAGSTSDAGGRGHLINASREPGTGMDSCYRIGGRWVVAYDESGHRRFSGFRPGDEVQVVGTLHGDQLHVTAVFGGSPEDYAATFRSSEWPLVIGVVIGRALVAGSVMIAYMMVCCTRGPLRPPVPNTGAAT